jgi:large subunit ribosomal protein L10
MAISKEKKGEIVAKLQDAFKDASSIAFVGFTKLTVADASKMRTQLKEAGVRYFVAKKTLLRLALTQKGYEGQIPELPGEVAVAWTNSEDVTAPTRGVYDFGKKMKGAITLLGGVFESSFIGAEKAIALATIPAMPVLRGMFVNVINSPIQGLVVALDKIREKKA